MAAALSSHAERRLTSGPAVDLRPNWDADGRSVVFERQEGGRSRLYRVAVGGGAPVALGACNQGAETVQGRPAFFGLDDFAFVSSRGGRLGGLPDREAEGMSGRGKRGVRGENPVAHRGSRRRRG